MSRSRIFPSLSATPLITNSCFARRSTPSVLAVPQKVFFSFDCEPAKKLRFVLEEYRREHFSRETPTRFKKELMKAVESDNGAIPVENLNQMLINIGRTDQTLSNDELQTLLREVGGNAMQDRMIPAASVMQLVPQEKTMTRK